MLINRGYGKGVKLGFPGFPHPGENPLNPLASGEKRLWKTLWIMFITCCTENY
jgi:hypothetical protein